MKALATLLCLLAIFSLTGCATSSKTPSSLEDLFRQADKNGDGKVSKTEYENFLIVDMFKIYDQDGDGFITEKEFVADGGTVKSFRAINAAGNGRLSLQEALASQAIRARLAAPFDEADVNRNGYVTFDEFKVARAKTRAYVR